MSLPFKVLTFDPKDTSKKIDGAAIIVLQEWWGINDTIKQHAQRIANNTGARTVLPDLYKGKIGLTAEEASHLMTNLDWTVAINELETLAKSLNAEGYTKLGAIGFCMGGGLSLALATQLTSPPLKAAVTCYGTTPDNFDVTKITSATAIQGHFGGKDTMEGFSDPAAANKLEVNLKSASDVNIYRYPEQGHAFLNDDDWSIEKRKELGFVDKNIEPRSQEQAIRDEAWSRIYTYLIKHLA
ncbi:dienelactone hydrolase [Zychaea mexicana]|uniref:dienelactone hydrolase n=1 Tax=Zychaea mexicana TaxID=64656 RepID=UPI0022FF0C5E|nr:dienelactone hydrolase [Zychaea mexicana]KAI9495369.1 dienelactone hydrolase [Zychaea mexicana]